MRGSSELGSRWTWAVLVLCVVEAWRVVTRPRVLAFVAPWLGAEILMSWALSRFPYPPLNWLKPLWIGAGGGEAHYYPDTYATLLRVLAWLDPLLELSLGFMGLALLVSALPDEFLGRISSWAVAQKRVAGRRRVAWLSLLATAGISGLLLMLADILPARGNVPLVLRVVAVALAISIRAMLLFALPAAILGRRDFVAAIRRSVGLAGNHLGSVFLLAGVGAAVTWPWRLSPEFVSLQFWRLEPEWVAAWAALGAVPKVLVAAFVMAVAVRLYLHEFGTERPA